MKRFEAQCRPALLALVVCLGASPATAQDFRGAISGTVNDSTGGVLPGAEVTVTNDGTRVAATVVTDAKGFYQVRYLISGTYSVVAKLSGFKSAVRKGVEVRVGDEVTVDATLEAGSLEEVVVVTAETPLLNTSSGVSGQVIDSNQIKELPLGDGTAYMLSRLAPGIADSSDLHFSRPMDNGNLAGVVANGARGGNEFTLDGAPNRVSPNTTSAGNNNGVVGFSPPSDAISEFKVQTNAFDAQAGQTAGATVNLALKSGTNSFDGSLAYFNRDDSRSATPLLTKRAGGEKPTRELQPLHRRPSRDPSARTRRSSWPSFEHLRDVQPEPSTYTVPTLRMRQGDFSEWSVPIFDPADRHRQQQPAHRLPGQRDPRRAHQPRGPRLHLLLPGAQPPRPGGQLLHQPAPALRLQRGAGAHRPQLRRRQPRVPHRLLEQAAGGPLQLGAGRAATPPARAPSTASRSPTASTTGATRAFTLGFTSTRSSSLLLDVRAAYSQFRRMAPARPGVRPGARSASRRGPGPDGRLPLPAPSSPSAASAPTNANSRLASLGSQRSDFGMGFDRPSTTSPSRRPSRACGAATPCARDTSCAIGAGRSRTPPTAPGGTTSPAPTRAPTTRAPLNDPAQSFAQFLLGLPTTGTGTVANAGHTASQFEIASPGDYRQASHGVFVQDDWRVSRKLTLNLGLRLEVEQAMTEADDRNLAGFDTTAASPIEAAGQAAYARNPIPEIPAGAVPGAGRRALRGRADLQHAGEGPAPRRLLLPGRRPHGGARRPRASSATRSTSTPATRRASPSPPASSPPPTTAPPSSPTSATRSPAAACISRSARRSGLATFARPDPRHGRALRAPARPTTRAGSSASSATSDAAGWRS